MSLFMGLLRFVSVNGYCFMIFIYARIDQMMPEQNVPTDSLQVHVWRGIWLAAGAALRLPDLGADGASLLGFQELILHSVQSICLNVKLISRSHKKPHILKKKIKTKPLKKNKHMPRPSNDKSKVSAWESNIIFSGYVGGSRYDIIQRLAKMSHFLTSSNYWDFISNRYLKVMFKIPNSRGIYIGDWFDPLLVKP